jgi:hypothetical protein
MSPRIVWRYRRKRHTPSAAGSRKQERGFGTLESQSAGGQQMPKLEEKDRLGKFQFQEEEEVQTKFQFQEQEEEQVQAKVQFKEKEEEEVQANVQLREKEEEETEEVQARVQLQEKEEEEVQSRLQFQEEEEETQAKPEPVRSRSARLIRSVAGSGFRGSPGSYPFQHRIQMAFGRHDISNVKAFRDAAAARANRRMGSLAYASREKVAFRGHPDLHTAAHEAAHVIQQRQGVQLKDGTGRKGDAYERHADAVADRVVQGKSAQDLLSRKPGSEGS